MLVLSPKIECTFKYMTKEIFTPTKEDKWLLASHMQKAIRRGLVEEAAWAAGHLHTVDRSYLAYRLSVIVVEDVAAGDLSSAAGLVGEVPWGAKRFGTARDEAERIRWQDTASMLAGLRKDRTPCDWIACRYWLGEFESQEGPWEELDPFLSIEEAENTNHPWWKRGLFAWRAAGTDRFPADQLPEVAGMWDDWVASNENKDLQTVMMGLGARQREPHPVFLPLAVQDRMNDPNAKKVDYRIDSVKHGPWLSAAIDGHTKPGISAAHQFARSLSDQALSDLSNHRASAAIMTRRMMFWMEGGHIDKGWEYTTQKKITSDIRRRWLREVNAGNGAMIVKHLARPEMWQKFRQKAIDEELSETRNDERKMKI